MTPIPMTTQEYIITPKKYYLILLTVFAIMALGLVLLIKGYDVEEKSTQEVKLYYYNALLDVDEEGNALCSEKGLVPVYRTVQNDSAVIENTLQLLLSGDLTEEEKQSGLTTEYPLEGFKLEDLVLKDGTLSLHFDDPKNRTSGGSCRAAVLWLQIEETAKQFEEVESVRFEPEWIFQP